MGQSAGKPKYGEKSKVKQSAANSYSGNKPGKQVYHVGKAKLNGGKSKGYWKSSGSDSFSSPYIWETPGDGGSSWHAVGGSGGGDCVTSSDGGGCSDTGFSSGGSSDSGCSSSSSSDSGGGGGCSSD